MPNHAVAGDDRVSSANTWFEWTDPDLQADTDPDYHWYQVTVRHVQVLHD